MSNVQHIKFAPDYLVTPGEVLAEYLDELRMTQTELAARTGLSAITINDIIKAKAPITHETSLKLECTLDRPAHFWSNLERNYQADLTRFSDEPAKLIKVRQKTT